MLAVRIIPVLLHRGTALVKGKQFKSWRSVGHVEQAVRTYQARGVDELCIADISATPEGKYTDVDLINRITSGCFMPVTVGGGVRTLNNAGRLMAMGADKVLINSAAHDISGFKFIENCAYRYGRQAIMVGIDVISGCVHTHCGTHNGFEGALAAVKRVFNAGAGEILLTSIERDGMMEGYDLDLIKAVSDAVDIPVIANGGCGTPEHMLQAIQAGASAVAASSMFLFTDVTPKSAAQYLAKNGIEVRL